MDKWKITAIICIVLTCLIFLGALGSSIYFQESYKILNSNYEAVLGNFTTCIEVLSVKEEKLGACIFDLNTTANDIMIYDYLYNKKVSELQACKLEENTLSIPIDSYSWHSVMSLETSNSMQTDTFKISGKKWRFTLSCDPTNEYDGFNLVVYDLNKNKDYVEFLYMQSCPDDKQTTYVYEGPGDYYFKLEIVNIDKWSVNVEDWY